MRKEMWKTGTLLTMLFCCLISLSSIAYAENLTVAVFDFESKDKGITTLGSKIASLITGELSSDPKLKMVERERLDRILDELGLSLSGIVSENEAAKIGQLAGAKILVIGRAFTVDGELIVVAKVIATETSRVKAEIVKGPISGKFTTIADEIAKKVHKVISEKGPSMVAKVVDIVSLEDRLDFLKAKLKGKKLPKVSVAVLERHFGAVTVDPAVETEVIYYLKKLGFTVISQKGNTLAGWASEYFKNANVEVPGEVGRVDVLIIGEAFSEFAMRRGNLVSGKARVELRAVDAKTGRVLAIDRETNTAVDLSEQMAAKKALQEAAGSLSYRLIPEFVDNWLGKPKTIAIMDFGNTTGDKKLTQWAKDYAEVLFLKLSRDERFKLVERKEIDKILEEVELNRSGYVDTKNAIKIGRMLGAQVMVLGVLLEINSNLRIDIHLVEPESGKILKADVIEGTRDNLKEMEKELTRVISTALLEVINRK
jgi:TolB-like protein